MPPEVSMPLLFAELPIADCWFAVCLFKAFCYSLRLPSLFLKRKPLYERRRALKTVARIFVEGRIRLWSPITQETRCEGSHG